METFGSTPQVNRFAEGAGIKRLYYSRREQALIKDKTCAAGYGVLKAGTVMAVNASAAGGKGELIPYVPVYSKITLGGESAIGAAPLVANGASGHLYVSKEDSYKFKVGDQLYYQNTAGDGLVDCGVITAIDTTTSAIMADISCGAYTATNATVAKGSYCFIVSGTTPFSQAKFILDKDVDTGVGENAKGALAPVLLSNAVLYTGSLVNATSEALTALGAITDGQHTILK